MIDHRGAVNTILDINRRFDMGSGDRALALSALSFDLSVYDVFGLLAAGGAVVMPDAAERREPAHWIEQITRHEVTIWNTAPVLMQMLADSLEDQSTAFPSTGLVMLSGDWIPLSLPDKVKAARPWAKVVSLGGAAEASIWSILHPIEAVDPNWSSIPYGKPMANQTFHILNDRMEPCPVWAPGQLFIGGIGVAKGCWRDEEKTRAVFIPHPETGEGLYKTGDLGRYLPDGNIEFLGREDFQVKIRGHRIELGEIETALRQHPAIREAPASAVGESRENRHLVAYIVTSRPLTDDSDKETFDSHLREKLPSYTFIGHSLRFFVQRICADNRRR